ncbi:BREX-1 system adenine-specific DNA-methyltransferase PglX [Shewanella glacialipiscicola]|uniref:BREX-1 system adenine-specific DNA-methyltransferase PglX n=1 Tax=Shewanella glacialipiscicola TaxID=614069 RepID=UPI003D7AFB12
MAFDQSTRNRLQKFVSNARAILGEEFTRQLQATYGLDPKQGTVAAIDSLTHLDNRQRQTAHLLRETLAHYLATTPGKGEKDRTKQVLDRIVREQAFTVLNRLAALRMAEARGFLLESIAKAHSSKGFQLYRQLSGTAHGETGDAYRNYLFSLFDEFSLDLAVLFDRHSAQGRLFPRESALLELLAEINHHEIEHLWAEDETIGWIYQFWNGRDEIDQMRSASRAPRTSREMAVRNQFFTPRYVVEFLTDNTLGRIWYEMTQGNTALVDSCRYLVRRPTEIFLKPGETAPEAETSDNEALSQEELLKQPVYIPYRPLKDPRSIRMLDPACGSMHFGLYAFDLFERIYLEAWQLEQQLGPDAFTREAGQQALQSSFDSLEAFKQQIPKLIIEHNIHGVDIDPRAVQIAGLSLWQRAQRAWHQQSIKPQQRPTIVKSNIVCAEPMPGEKALLQEFTNKLNPPVLGQLLEVIFDKMQLAGEAGTLLKIEEEIQTAIHEAREQWLKQSGSNSVGDMFQAELDAATPQAKLGFDLRGIDDETFWDDAEQRILQALSDYADQAESNADQKRLFAEDAAKGFAFIDLCRKRFDVVLMNPPFGDASSNSKKYIEKEYSNTKSNILAAFVERGLLIDCGNGRLGAITSRTCLYLSTMSGLREEVLGKDKDIELCADLGDGVLDAMVETAAYVISSQPDAATFYRLVIESEKESSLRNLCGNLNPTKNRFITNLSGLKILPESPYCYWVDQKTIKKIDLPIIETMGATIKVGLQTGDDFRFLRNYWEIPVGSERWKFYAKTEEAVAWHSPINLVVNWSRSGHEVKNFCDSNGKLRSRPQNLEYYFNPGFSYMNRSSRIVPYIVPRGCIPSAGRSQAFPYEDKEVEALTVCASNLGSAVARFRGEKFGWPKFQAGMIQQLPFAELSDEVKSAAEKTMLTEVAKAKEYYSTDETTLDYVGCDRFEIKREPNTNFKTLLGEENDIAVAECYGLSAEEYEDLQLDLQQAVSLRKEHEETSEEELAKQAAFRYLSWLVGRAFGRWSETVAYKVDSDIYAELPEQAQAFQHQRGISPIQDHGIADLESNNSLVKHIELIANPELSEKCLSLLEAKSWSLYLSKPTHFFTSHYNQYSQNRRYAPIYWPLQTPSGSYTLWVYYHRLNEQTLYTCVNDFVEPKLQQVEKDLNVLRSKSARSSQEEKELEKLSELVSELRDFRDELLRLAKFWKPNLNDGVQITAAPLWKLFQHKAWQKKLKETWESLEKGDYDWAHLACSIWPERVLRKCHQDRSLAIAHDVEEHFWHEVEVPVKRGKKFTGETKLEWQPKALNEPALLALIKQIKEERGL